MSVHFQLSAKQQQLTLLLIGFYSCTVHELEEADALLLNQRQMLMLQRNVVQGTCTKLLQGDRDSCILNPNEHNGAQIEKIDHYRWAQHLAIDLSSLCRYLLCSRGSQTGTSAEHPLYAQHLHDKVTTMSNQLPVVQKQITPDYEKVFRNLQFCVPCLILDRYAWLRNLPTSHIWKSETRMLLACYIKVCENSSWLPWKTAKWLQDK